MADGKASLNQLENTLEEYLVKKAPFQLPTGVKEFLVKIAPWATLIMLIITIPLVLVAFGLGALVAPFSVFLGPQYAVSYGVNYIVSMVVLAVALIFEAMAIPGLFSRSTKGWRFAYYATLVSLLSNLVSFQVISGLLSAIIGLYFLFQIKSYYK